LREEVRKRCKTMEEEEGRVERGGEEEVDPLPSPPSPSHSNFPTLPWLFQHHILLHLLLLFHLLHLLLSLSIFFSLMYLH